MKITESAHATLKNFAAINTGLVFKPGKVQKTISQEKQIMAEAVLDVEFPREFAIYELSQFLDVMSTFKTPELDFQDTFVKIFDETLSLKWFYAEPSFIISPPDKELKQSDPLITFQLKKDELVKLLKIANGLNLPNFIISSTDNKVVIQVKNKAEDTSNIGSVEIKSDYEGDDFESVLKIEHLKVIPDNYEISLFKTFALFESKENERKYLIALTK